MASSRLVLKPEDYEQIDRIVGRKAGSPEFYTVVTSRVRGKFIRSFHVFARQPTPAEMTKFEDTASKVRVKGRKTEFEGSQSKAFRHLYDALIIRAYNVPVGFEVLAQLNGDLERYDTPATGLAREEAIEKVPLVIKREALRDTMGEVYSEGRLSELEGEDDEVAGSKEDD